jgi:hypothetical protein
MKQVAVSQGVLIGMGAGMLASLLLLGFLLGRESARRNSPAEPARVHPTTEIPGAPPAPVSEAPSHASSQVPSEAAPSAALESVPASPPAYEKLSPSHAAALGADPMRAPVAAYFEAIERIQPGQLGGDPSEVANQIVEAMGKGDTSGLDDLTRKMEAAKRRLEALDPPKPCALHHRESLASLEEGLRMLRSMKKSIASSDVDGLSKLASQGETIRSRSEALSREEQALRQRYGLSR